MKLVNYLLLLIICTVYLHAQEPRTIQGTVFYAEDKTPVPFAYVRVKGVALGTVTDFDGSFKLVIPEQYLDKSIEFSYLGLKTVEKNVKEEAGPWKIYLETDIQELYAVIVTGERPKNPKGILRKAVRMIPENYVSEAYQTTGYYREIVKEYNQPIRYADASYLMNLEPHQGPISRKKNFEKPDDASQANTVGSWTSMASSLHRWHFHQSVLKGEKAKIIEAKSSDDLTNTRLTAHIQAGPLSAMTKDRVKYPFNFMTDYNKYNYELLDVMFENAEHYLITFEPLREPFAAADAIEAQRYGTKAFRQLSKAVDNKHKLSGSLLIRKDDLAIVKIDYKVPAAFKNELCGYRGWSIRHFDFKVAATYSKTPMGYALDHLIHEDEFIVEDTLNEVRIPYQAISELYTHEVAALEEIISEEENFSNSDYNHLFDLPDGYNKKYWTAYEAQHTHAQVPPEISSSMARRKPLTVQFASKLIRDTLLTPPVAPEIITSYDIHGQTIIDEYAWLKDTINPRGNEQIMQYLDEENRYTENYFRPLKTLRKDIYREIRNYVQDDFTSLPVVENGYQYYYQLTKDKEYPVYLRKDTTTGSAEEILFDVNQMAEGKEYFDLSGITISPNNQLAAFQVNDTGSDRWVLKFKDLSSNRILSDSVEMVGQVAWLDNETLYFTQLDPKTYRTGKLFRYDLVTQQTSLVFHEPDKTYDISLRKSRSREILFLQIAKANNNEVRFLSVTDPSSGWKTIAPRRKDHLYRVSHFEDQFLIISNHQAANNQVWQTSVADYSEENWKVIRPEEEDIEILGVLPFKNYHAYQERHGMEIRMRIKDLKEGKEYFIKQHDTPYIDFGSNPEYDTDTLQFFRNSYTSPMNILNIHMGTKKLAFKQSVGKYTDFVFRTETEVVYATSHDGKQIPITLIYDKKKRKSMQKAGEVPPLYITGYGAYGSRNLAGYDPSIAPLTADGAVYAIAHVRGGGDLGLNWYKQGKLSTKKNTFEDFISCTEHLISLGYGKKGEVVAEGGSAGGLLMGAIANMRPDLYGLVILDVPFVDVINTMLDDKLPLTVQEYEEWGNPSNITDYEYIASYSPYENVTRQAYPHMLFLTAINDTRVGYWEPAKMVARLRKHNSSVSEILLQTDFSAGHGGAAGRYERLSQVAFKYALILDWMRAEKQADTPQLPRNQ